MTDRPPDPAAALPPQPGSLPQVLDLIRQVGGLADVVSLERSFRLSQGRLDRDRLLLGIDRPAGIRSLDEAICRVCSHLGMPEDQGRDFRQHLVRANHVYFGAERTGDALTLKVYLEFRDAIAQALQTDPGGADTHQLYTGYKWSAAGRPVRAVSQYRWQPGLSPAGLLQRLDQLAGPQPEAPLWRFITDCAQRALARLSPQVLQFVEVQEPGHPRASVDLNVYRMGWCLDDLRPMLDEVVQHLGLPTQETAGFFARIGRQQVGHVAGGIDRQGQGFLTLYHGGTQVAGHRLQAATVAPMTPVPAP